MGMMPVHQRIAELWTVMQGRALNDQEAVEMHHCLKENARMCWEAAYLENMSLMASMTSDVDWQHEVCQEIDQFEVTGKRKKKKPGRKATD